MVGYEWPPKTRSVARDPLEGGLGAGPEESRSGVEEAFDGRLGAHCGVIGATLELGECQQPEDVGAGLKMLPLACAFEQKRSAL